MDRREMEMAGGNVQMRYVRLTDFENHCLNEWDARQGIPTGPKRYEDEAWAAHVLSLLEDSEFGWSEYVTYVNEGYGDEWFME